MSFLWNALLFSIIFRIFAIIMKEISELNDLSIAMKVTKVRTKQGDFCTPVSTLLEAAVSRMQQAKTKAAAEVVERNAMVGRLMEEEGRHRIALPRCPLLVYQRRRAYYPAAQQPVSGAAARRTAAFRPFRSL